jgi:ABC-type Zn uptake system ZnuABC Zn-binding protein ZnuA
MRSTICVVIMLALIGLTGCAKNDSEPADQPETQTETTVIATEDFESGEVESVVEDTEEVVEEAPDGGDSVSTP